MGEQAHRNASMRLFANALSPVVHKVRYTLLNEETGETITHEAVINRNMTLPGGLPGFEERPLDPNSRHNFTDFFTALPAGTYTATVTPLGENGASLEGTCFGSSRSSVVATAGQTTEILLMIQCKSQDPAALDVLATINHAPQLTNVVFERVGTEPTQDDSAKFTCSNTLRVCASAKDIDNDPLNFFVDAPSECTVTPGAKPAYPPATPGAELSQCFEITCPDSFKGTRVDFDVNVVDMAWRAGEIVPIESILRDRGINQLSRSTLKSFGYFLEASACEGTDPVRPDCKRPETLPAATEVVFIQDVTESMASNLPLIREQLPGVVEELTQRVGAPGNSEECPLTAVEPRTALVATADKPFGIFGAVNVDYVYREALKASAFSSRELVDAHKKLVMGIGGSEKEAQLEALLAAAQNTSRLGLNGAAPAAGRFAVVLTNSDFHEALDCPWDLAAPVCSFANNNNGIVDLREDYPTQERVAQELVAQGITPIFVVVKQGENGGSQTTTMSTEEITQRYLGFANLDAAMRAAVVQFDPNDSARPLRTVIREGINAIQAQ